MKRPFWTNHLPAFLLLFVFTWYIFSIQSSDFEKPYSTVVYSSDLHLLGARIASDGQWRFPVSDSVPEKFRKCILTFEDKYFYHHPGINPPALFRAVYQNIKQHDIVSGGSTLSMQVIRLIKGNKQRTVARKLYEMILATRLELGYSKNEILRLYASLAPFGGNVVGLEAASWKYFRRDPFHLSWAETATLAVLPNAPSLIHPGKNREALKKKRNKLLRELHQSGYIDAYDYDAALIEPLPEKTYPLPQHARHLVNKIYVENQGAGMVSTLDYQLQRGMENVLLIHYKNLRYNHIHNIAALVIEINSGQVKAYAGNVFDSGQKHQNAVDVVQAPRSTGSILKPLLYAVHIEEGKITPESLIPDIPVRFSGYMPENFSKSYDGAVRAKLALARSLNVPAVLMLRQHGQEKFYNFLENIGISTLNYPAEHYGLSLILGGAEASLWELASVYAACAVKLNRFIHHPSVVLPKTHYTVDDAVAQKLEYLPDAGSLWLMFEALQEVNRPDQETGWRYFSSSRKVAWKTGTSFGFKDAWAIGTTPEYLVAVWVGNADGEGRPGLTGIDVAAPAMFDIFDLLPATTWFEQPFDDMKEIPVCAQSGFAASSYCPDKKMVWASMNSSNLPVCQYHKLIHLTENLDYRVTKNCYSGEMITVPWFVLPSHIEYYYANRHLGYRKLPAWHPDCQIAEENVMEIVFPTNVKQVYIPRNLDGTRSEIMFEIAHRYPDKKIYWHLDNEFLAVTENIHELGFFASKGSHSLTLVDEDGATLTTSFLVVDRQN